MIVMDGLALIKEIGVLLILQVTVVLIGTFVVITHGYRMILVVVAMI